MRLFITGSIAFDYLMAFPGRFREHLLPDKLDRLSVSFLVDTLHRRRGGCAANIAYNLALMGEQPLLIGAAGRDFETYGRALEEAGVDISGVYVYSDVYTASFFANTDVEGNQIASFYPGAMQYAARLNLKELCRDQGIAVISPDDPGAMMRHVRQCGELGIPYVFDPSQQIVRLSGEELTEGSRGAYMVIFNEYELEMFAKKTGLKEQDLLEGAEVVVVTLGEKGARIRVKDRIMEIPPARPERVLDPTGVGDAFRAGLMKGIVHGLGWETSGRMGSLAAVYVLETDGPQNHRYSLADFLTRYREQFGPDSGLAGMTA